MCSPPLSAVRWCAASPQPAVPPTNPPHQRQRQLAAGTKLSPTSSSRLDLKLGRKPSSGSAKTEGSKGGGIAGKAKIDLPADRLHQNSMLSRRRRSSPLCRSPQLPPNGPHRTRSPQRLSWSTDQTGNTDSVPRPTSPETDGRPNYRQIRQLSPARRPTTQCCRVRISQQCSIFWRTACVHTELWHRSRSDNQRPR